MKKEEKKEIEQFKKQNKKYEKKNKQKANIRWVTTLTLMAFVISFCFSFFSETILPNAHVLIGILLVFVFIGLGIIFDMVGVAVTAADEKPFHSMSAHKVHGAKVAIMFKKNADKVASFCCDVIGDICGIISGSAGVIVSTNISSTLHLNTFIITLSITAFIAALTIGGKALGKSLAMTKCNMILYEFSKIVSIVYHPGK